MPNSPLGNLPLRSVPHKSRITDAYQDNKNYYLVAFNPGYSLQASELNEIQELFFLNQSLTQRMNGLWGSRSYLIPFWEGLIPLDPNMISYSTLSVSGQNANALINIDSGWFLWTDKESKLSFWLYLETPILESITTSGNTKEYFGLNVENLLITCCPTNSCEVNQDSDLRDNSQGDSLNYFTCGASRFKATIQEGILVRTTVDSSDFNPIGYISIQTTNGTSTASIKFIDDQDIVSTQ